MDIYLICLVISQPVNIEYVQPIIKFIIIQVACVLSYCYNDSRISNILNMI